MQSPITPPKIDGPPPPIEIQKQNKMLLYMNRGNKEYSLLLNFVEGLVGNESYEAKNVDYHLQALTSLMYNYFKEGKSFNAENRYGFYSKNLPSNLPDNKLLGFYLFLKRFNEQPSKKTNPLSLPDYSLLKKISTDVMGLKPSFSPEFVRAAELVYKRADAFIKYHKYSQPTKVSGLEIMGLLTQNYYAAYLERHFRNEKNSGETSKYGKTYTRNRIRLIQFFANDSGVNSNDKAEIKAVVIDINKFKQSLIPRKINKQPRGKPSRLRSPSLREAGYLLWKLNHNFRRKRRGINPGVIEKEEVQYKSQSNRMK